MDNVKSLKIALAIVLIVSLALIGVSYSRQKNAENKVAFLHKAINSTDNLEVLRGLSGNFSAYSGAGSSASASKFVGKDALGNSCYVAEHGDDAGQMSCPEDNHDWWNPFSWF